MQKVKKNILLPDFKAVVQFEMEYVTTGFLSLISCYIDSSSIPAFPISILLYSTKHLQNAFDSDFL